jgi:hypothetical protein
MKNKLLVLMLGLAAFIGMHSDAEAISLRFKFKVFSSGPDIYACNAGVRHKSTTSQVCYFEGTTTACTPNDCRDKGICDTQCICTGNSGGDSLMDFLKVTRVDWKDHRAAGDNLSDTNVQTLTRSAPTNGAWAQAIADNAATWETRIKDLSFELGSELYGAEYFVDVCYRGPQIEYFANGVPVNSQLQAQASATDFLATAPNPGDNSRDGLTIPGVVDGKTYGDLSGLQVKAFFTCDLQGEGNYKYAHNGSSAASGSYNTSVNEATFALDGSTGYPASGGDLFGSSGSFSTLAGNGLDLINSMIVSGTHSPRFCKIRYVFTETNEKSALPFMRKWQRHGTEVCTYSRIEEALGQAGSSSEDDSDDDGPGNGNGQGNGRGNGQGNGNGLSLI